MARRSTLALAGLLASCGAVDPRPEQAEARAWIRAATGESRVFDPEEAPLAPAEIEALLADGLGADEAARLALLGNRRLQAGFARLAVGKAELVQAGLLRNPSLSLGFLLPGGGGSPKLTLDLVASVAELWQLPRREALARAELAGEVLALSHFAAELVLDVRLRYLEALAARERVETAREGRELARSELEAWLARVAAGVATEADAALARTAAAEAELAALQAELEAGGAKRALAALLSLERDLAPVELTDPLPEPGAASAEREALVARARAARLDLRASAKAVEAARAALELEHGRRLPELDLALLAERPELGNEPDLLLGPGVTLELPVFDAKRVAASAARHELEARIQEHAALELEVAQAVRAAADRHAAAARAAQHVAEVLLPRAERGHELAVRAQSLGSATLLAVLESQRAVLAARASLVTSRLEAARARLALERALGAPLAMGAMGR